MKKPVFLLLIPMLVAIFALSSCDSFFSDSLGSSRDYDPAKISLTIENVGDWVRASVGNPPLARAVTIAIMDKIDSIVDEAERAVFLQHAARLAMEASGVGISILQNSGDLLGGFTLEAGPVDLAERMKDLLDSLQSDFENKGGVDTADNLASLVNKGISGEGAPRFDPEFADKLSSADVTEAIIVLLLGEMSKPDNNFHSGNINIANLGLRVGGSPVAVHVVGDGDNPPSENATALAAYLNLITDDSRFANNPFTKAISNVLLTGAEEEEGEEEEDEE
ncbi:MAG: hypothetical protein FWG77_01935 [Treponema sp.]|nr:hypothetical protein [Treponema sp.]